VRSLQQLALVLILSSTAGVAQMPAGAHSTDDHSQIDAVNAQIGAAESAMEKNDFAAADASLEKLAVLRPHDARVLYDLGFAQERNGAEDAAAKSYTAAIATNGGLAEARVALGLLDARAGRTDAARDQLRVVASMEAAAPELRGRAFRALATLDEAQHPDVARDELLAAVKLTGETSSDLAMSAELASHAGEAADAETAYRKALAIAPGNVDAAAGLAHALEQQNKLPEAEAVLADALKEHEIDPRLVSQLASVYVAEDKAKQAASLLERLRAANPQYAADPAVAKMLARVYAMGGDDANAEKLYAELANKNPKDPALLDDYGSLLVREQHYAQAESVLAQSVSMRSEFHDDAAWAGAAGHLGFAASKNGQPQIALQALTARATVLPDTPPVVFLKAISYDSLHQRKLAIEAYHAFLAMAGGKFPDEEFQARHRLVALEHER
jgi:Flp pilus assembly protein TadD